MDEPTAEWWSWDDCPPGYKARIRSFTGARPHTVLYIKELQGPRVGGTLCLKLAGDYNLFSMGPIATPEQIAEMDNEDFWD